MKILAIMMVSHFVADFLLQSREMGKTKSTVFKVLLEHIIIQYLTLWAALLFFVGPTLAVEISLCNALVHGLIDWNIWKLYKWSVIYRLYNIVLDSGARRDQMLEQIEEKAKGWQYWEDHWFYTTIGTDQLLHGLTLVALAGWFL